MKEKNKKSGGCRCPWCQSRSKILCTYIYNEELTGYSKRECKAKKCGKIFYA